jgi:hypothetical protein
LVAGLAQAPAHFEPIQAWHRDVEDHSVGGRLRQRVERLLAVRGATS